MINTCPYCGFTPLAGKMVCPECGREIEENIAHKLQDIDEKNRKNNDSISWNDFQDVSLGALMNHLENNGTSSEDVAKDSDESKEVESVEADAEELEEFAVPAKDLAEESLTDDETDEFDQNDETEAVDHLDDNPILSAYIKRHREGSDAEGPSLEELVAAQQAATKKDHGEEINEATPALNETPTPNVEEQASDPADSETTSQEQESEVESEALEAEHDEETAEEVAESSKESSTVPETEEEMVPEVEADAETPLEETDDLVTDAPAEVVPEALANENQTDTDEELSEEAQWDEADTEELDEIPVEVQGVVSNLQTETPIADEKIEKAAIKSDANDSLTEEATTESVVESEPVVSEVNEAAESQATIATTKESKTAPVAKKRQKWPIVLAAAVLLAGGGSAYAYHQQQVAQEQKQAQAKEKALAAELKDLKKSVGALYLNDGKDFLKAGLTSAEVTGVLKQVEDFSDTLKTKDLKAELTDIQEKLALQDQVNGLYTKPVISGDVFTKDVPIATMETIDLDITGDDPFDQLLAEGVQAAKDQLTQLNNAQAAMTSLVKDGKAVAEPKEADYQAAQKLVAEMVASEEKTALSDQLKLVETKINENKAAAKAAAEKAAQEKAAQEKAAAEKAAQEQAAKEAAAASSTNSNLPAEASPNMQTNSANQPILATDAADVADSSNPAWTWSSGVLDQVIATCIERGYIVEGGYKLERVRIENGEGYYNLYATTNQAPLTANYKAKDLPLYLVTINCKTGYFRGNGNDHTVR